MRKASRSVVLIAMALPLLAGCGTKIGESIFALVKESGKTAIQSATSQAVEDAVAGIGIALLQQSAQ